MKTRTGPQSDVQHEEPSRIDSMMHKMFRVPRLSVAGSDVTVGPSWSARKRQNSSPKKSPVPLLWALLGLLAGGGTLYEMRTSAVQSWMLSYAAGRMTYSVEPGPSTRIDFPKEGPFDESRGYTRIPQFEDRLRSSSFRVVEQARFSPALQRLVKRGIAPPYHEPPSTRLTILGQDGLSLYKSSTEEQKFQSYDDIPPLVVRALLLMENRELADPASSHDNPALDWNRLAKAGLLYAGRKVGLPVAREGGSTLATQLEKYRHSPHGRSSSIVDKLHQMTGASLNAYREGRDTSDVRKEIILDYLNTVPLAAAPGYGEVHGLGEGLYAWFGRDLKGTCAALSAPSDSEDKVKAFKTVILLLAAVRAPTHYLTQDRKALVARARFYLDRLAEGQIIGQDFKNRVKSANVGFLRTAPTPARVSFARRKASNTARTQLLQLLGVDDYYDLDRLHLEVRSTLDVSLQNKIAELFDRLKDPKFLEYNGLRQERLLLDGDPARVVYSLLLYERTPWGNAERVHIDNLDQPFDMNSGMKMELGSTAKLRTLAHYLEVVGGLHQELSALGADRLEERARLARDPLTRWAAETLLREKEIGLSPFLEMALDRTYSANPGEVFYTGGGVHSFSNFDHTDNGRILTIREATQRSVNLVYIRLMRDLVRFHEARLPYDPDAVLSNPDHPERRRLLEEMAEEEAKEILLRSYQDYRGQTPSRVIDQFLGSRAKSSRDLAILYFAWHPINGKGSEEIEAGLMNWLNLHLGSVTLDETRKLAHAYANPRLNLLDYAYLLRRHPLELYCAGKLHEEPALSWKELWANSKAARDSAASWLLNTRHSSAQDVRLRIHIEQDAFARMTPYWRRLGFPFEHLTPSYATAIGDSSDRPIALADLMGIIANDGIRLPVIRFEQIRLAPDTPYHTVFEPIHSDGERVMSASVAHALREVLADVVEKGTARRLSGAFVGPDGNLLVVGGKTGSGDNRFKAFARGGQMLSSRAVNRTATFVFYIGERYFGVVLAYVPGADAEHYTFTSSLPVAILRILAPSLKSDFNPGGFRKSEAGKLNGTKLSSN